MATPQPPSGGCVLKQARQIKFRSVIEQPPSGGCVLKQAAFFSSSFLLSAAFGRLCVETVYRRPMRFQGGIQPPSGGCVLKRIPPRQPLQGRLSRLRAAVC